MVIPEDPPEVYKGLEDLPHYSTPGWLLVEITYVYPCESARFVPWRRYEIEQIEFDREGASFWINEGYSISSWVEDNLDLEQPGWYVIEGITGTVNTFWGADGKETEEEFEFQIVRYATEEEIATRSVKK